MVDLKCERQIASLTSRATVPLMISTLQAALSVQPINKATIPPNMKKTVYRRRLFATTPTYDVKPIVCLRATVSVSLMA